MSNFLLGIKAISSNIFLILLATAQDKIVLGSVFGFLIATLIHGFIITQNPRYIPTILRHSKVESFERLASRDATGSFLTSFSNFSKNYNYIRGTFSLAFIAFCLLLIIILFTQAS